MDGRRIRRWVNAGVALIAVPLGVAIYAPQALAFPHHGQIGQITILSEAPIAADLARTLARADALVASSPLAAGPPAASDPQRTLVLTDGGWRWRVLAVADGGAVALRRPLSSALIFNRADVARDRAAGGWRSLSGTIAHETTHLLVARRFREVAALRAPAWVNQGLADVVAQESPLTDREAAHLRRVDPGARRLFYYDARRRVAAALQANGGSVRALYAAPL